MTTLPTTVEQCQVDLVELASLHHVKQSASGALTAKAKSAQAETDELQRRIDELTEHLHYLADAQQQRHEAPVISDEEPVDLII